MEVVAVCPETAAGLPVPRPPAEHRNGRVVFSDGVDATEAFERGSAACLEEVLAAGVDFAVLKAKSPSCGAGRIHDGTFTGGLVDGWGTFAALVRDAGIPVLYHNCGRCEDLLPPMVRLGVKIWDPAQVENDLVEVKNRFGRQLIINGGFEFKPKGKLEDVTEEQTREAVRATFDKLAPNGSWIFSGMVYTLDFMDPTVQKINGWIMDEANRLSVEVYKH